MNSAKIADIRAAIAQHMVERPNTKCAVDGCPNYRQDAWDKARYTPAPAGWTCSHNQDIEI